VARKKGDEEERIQVREVIADNHRGTNRRDLVIYAYFLSWSGSANDTEEDLEKTTVQPLESAFRVGAEQGRSISPGKDTKKAEDEPGPVEKGYAEVDASAQHYAFFTKTQVLTPPKAKF
jgi:hypothetical protein